MTSSSKQMNVVALVQVVCAQFRLLLALDEVGFGILQIVFRSSFFVFEFGSHPLKCNVSSGVKDIIPMNSIFLGLTFRRTHFASI